jgi:hypothetical protein
MALLRSGTRIYGNATIDTVLDISGQDTATSNTTGALKVAGGIGVKGNVFSSGNITSLNANLGNLVVANYYQGTLTTSSQPNITSVGTLSNLTVSGNISGGNATFTGNLIVNGDLVYANISTLNVKDPIIEQGGGVDGTPLVTNDGKDRGSLLHYYTGSTTRDAFMGWDNSNAEFAFGSNVTLSSEVVTFNTFGNVRADNFIGNLTGSASTVTTAAQPNITSVGTLTSLTVTGNVSAANVIATIRTASQPDITSLGTLTGLNVNGPANLGPLSNVRIMGGSTNYTLTTDGNGNLTWTAPTTAGNANISGTSGQLFFNNSGSNTLGTSANLTFDPSTKTLTADKFLGDGSQLTGIAASGITGDATLGNLNTSKLTSSNANIGNLNVTSTANLGNISNIKLNGGTSGQVVITDGAGNLSFASVQACVVSQITSIVAGSAIDISVDYGNSTYPAGIFTLNQLGPVSLSTTDAWASGGSSKNAYANFIASSVNTQNISITLTLANATFNIQSSDTITIGGYTVTGGNLTGLGITGTGGTYTIPSGYLNALVQTNSTNSVTTSLTTSRGVKTSNGTTLTNNQPVPFNVTALSGSFPTNSVPYWSLNQAFNWSATTTSGAVVASGNVTYSGGSSGTLTTTGTTSGSSSSVDSTLSYTITSSDYFGAGGFGAGSRSMTSTVTGTVNPATKYYPLFYKITANSTVPTFTTSDSRGFANIVIGTTFANTNTTPTDYLWMATPTSASRTFKHVFLGSDIVDTPAVTADATISGEAYKVWGFTTFSQVASIIITS